VLVVAWFVFLPLPIGESAVAAARAVATVDHNPVPFATLNRQLVGGLRPFELQQWLGNVMLLLPLGLYGPARWPALRSLPAAVLAGAVASGAIELAQLGLATGYGFPIRVADIDDVLLNTLGVALGWVVWRSLARGGETRWVESAAHDD
jgi:glycopeptide antibiotics resistance protein